MSKYKAEFPIALASPTGEVFAYACPRCKHLATTAERTVNLTSADITEYAMGSLRRASKCCLCARCGDLVDRDLRSLFDPRPPTLCGPCWDAEAQDRERALVEAEVERVRHSNEYMSSLDFSINSHAAIELEMCMREISEDGYCAGWDSAMPETLWTLLTMERGDYEYGMTILTAERLDQLRRLRDAAGGWWEYNRFVPYPEYEQKMRKTDAKGS